MLRGNTIFFSSHLSRVCSVPASGRSRALIGSAGAGGSGLSDLEGGEWGKAYMFLNSFDLLIGEGDFAKEGV